MKAELSAQDIDELDQRLAATPAPLEALDVVMLDGYLCGVAVQPRLLEASQWLPPVFDAGAFDEAEGVEPEALQQAVEQRRAVLLAPEQAEWRQRTEALIQRRFEEIKRGLAEDRMFDPVVTDTESEAEAAAEDQGATAEDAQVGPHSRAMLPWVSGFMYACELFEDLLQHPDDAVHLALSHILRHLPAHTDEERAIVAELDREHPLHSETEAIEEVITSVADLWDLTAKERMAVAPLKRSPDKVGRNDPCPCGSGRKYKACHGRA